VKHTIELARSLGKRVVLNPAPIRPLSREVLSDVDVLTPNEHEAAGLLGIPAFHASEAPAAARELLRMGVGSVVITLGSEGAYAVGPDGAGLIQPRRVVAVDTTAAGDAFTASLACGRAEGKSLMESARFAASVAAIAVTRMGAQSSMPTREEVESSVSD
jgi:ribokinase